MLFDGHGDVWTDVTCKRVDHNETDIFRKYHLKKFQAGKVTGGIFVIWIDPPYDQDPPARSKQIVESIKAEMIDSADLLNFVTKFDDLSLIHISVRIIAHASSTRSMALSGRNRSEIYRSDSVAAAISAAS